MYLNSLRSAVIMLVKISQLKYKISGLPDANANKIMTNKNWARELHTLYKYLLCKLINKLIGGIYFCPC